MNEVLLYKQAVKAIKTAILKMQYKAASGVNQIQLSLYFAIGKYVSENSRNGTWGKGAIESISRILHDELPGLRGFSASNIKNMRQFYEAWNSIIFNSPATAGELNDSVLPVNNGDYEINAVVLETTMKTPATAGNFNMDEFLSLSFTHHVEILNKTKTVDERLFYIHQGVINHWSKYELRDHLKWNDYHHQGAEPNNFAKSLSKQSAMKAAGMFKDEYMLDFINVEDIDESDNMCVNEREIENSIVRNIRQFIMTFGRKFCFITNQYHFRAAGHDFYIDLLFFNRELNCLVAIELKAGEFKIPYLGELQTYLRILDENEKQEDENPSIGLILCRKADRNMVEYVIQDYDKPMGVATYTTSRDMPERLRNALPDIEDLRKLLDVEQ